MHTPHFQSHSRNLCIASSFSSAYCLQKSSSFIWCKWKHAFQVEKIVWTSISVEGTQIIRTGVVAQRYYSKSSRRSRVWLINSTFWLPLQHSADCQVKQTHTKSTSLDHNFKKYLRYTDIFHWFLSLFSCLISNGRLYY